MCATEARHRAQRRDPDAADRGFWSARDLVAPGRGARAAHHARRSSPLYALHIGRLGALAVSLGIGLAVANSAGAAYADTESNSDSSSVSSSADGESGADTDASASPASGPRGDSPDGADSGDDETSGDAGESGDAGDAPDLEAELDADPDDESETVAEDAAESDDTDEPKSVEDTVSEIPDELAVSGVTTEDDGAATEEGSSAGRGDVADTPRVLEPEEQAPKTTELVVDLPTEGPAADVGVADSGARTAVARLIGVGETNTVESASAVSPARESVETVDVVSTLVSSVVSPFADPEAPAQAPWFDAVLAWVRRQINHTLFNKSPVYGPIETEQLLTGQVAIDLGEYDPNGDPLTYTIVQPTHGLVVREPITGKFIYTPTSLVTGDPMSDSFQVVLSDSSEHLTGPLGVIQSVLHGIARYLGIAEADDVTVTVPVTVNPIVMLPPVVATVGAPVFTLGGAPVTLLSAATITDADSDELSAATVRILTAGQDGDVLDYVAPEGNPVSAAWDAATLTLTLTGQAGLAQYEQALQAVTFSATAGGLPRGVEINVIDEHGVQSLVPGVALVTVIGLPPSIVVLGAPVHTIGAAPVNLITSATIVDLDSDELSGATVAIAALAQDGDTLGYIQPGGNPITASWDAVSKTLTLTGAATKAQYEQALGAVTFSATGGALLVRTVAINVVDDAGVGSAIPAVVLANVSIPLPPLVTPVGRLLPYGAGGGAVNPITSVEIVDADSASMSGATVRISTNYNNGDVLGYAAPADTPITAIWDVGTRTLTLFGTATKAQYEEALMAVTFFATTPGGLLNLGEVRTIGVTVTDDAAVDSLTAPVLLSVTV